MSGHPLLQLSAAGVRHAARARHLPAGELARRVYAFHTMPPGAASRDRLDGWPEVASWLGLDGDQAWVRCLAAGFGAAPDPEGHWMHWRRPGVAGPLPHKLYVSPRAESLPGLFPRLADTFSAMEVPAFKLGAAGRGLRRPDKLVAYFASRDHLSLVAEELAAALLHVPAHGVPFTPPLDRAGLLSWGTDPGEGGGSWRLWIVQALASGVAGAPPGVALDETVAHARAALRSAGVDPDTWEPTGGML